MFNSPGARFALRAALVGVAAFVSALIAVDTIGSAELIKAALGALGTALAYAGIGAAVPAVEPNVGNKQEPGEGLARSGVGR